MANLVAKFKLEKQKEINAVFKIQKVVPADGIEEQLQAEIDRATAKEQDLQENINSVSIALDFETQARETADTSINSAIALEIANRINADNNLQAQINTKQPMGDYATNSRVDSVVDAFDNDIEAISNEIEDLIQNKADKSELTNLITRQEIEHLISQIQQFKHEVVEQLPQKGNSNIMYLVLKPNTPNVYEEYIWLEEEQRYEDIGSTAVDLSEYAKTSDISATYATKSQLLLLSSQLSNYDKPIITKANNNQNGIVKHTDGRMEQWGLATSSNTGETEFTMNNSFIDTNFQVFIEPRQAGDLVHYAIPSAKNKFKARIQNTSGSFMTCQFQWRAYGFWK